MTGDRRKRSGGCWAIALLLAMLMFTAGGVGVEAQASEDEQVVTRVHDLRDLLDDFPEDFETGEPTMTRTGFLASISKLLKETVNPGEWEEAAANSKVRESAQTMRVIESGLVVRATETHQRELAQLLDQIRERYSYAYQVQPMALVLTEEAREHLARRGVWPSFATGGPEGTRVQQVVGRDDQKLMFGDEPLPYAVMRDLEVEWLLDAAEKNEDVKLTRGPTMTLYNLYVEDAEIGDDVAARVQVNRALETDWATLRYRATVDGEADADVLARIREGSTLVLKADEPRADGRQVLLLTRVELVKVQRGVAQP